MNLSLRGGHAMAREGVTITIGGRIQGAIGSLKKVEQAVGKLAKAAAAGAAVSGLAASVAGLNRAMSNARSAETMRIQFEVLIGSARKAERTLRDLTNFAATTPLELPEITDAAKKLIAYGFDAATVTEQLRRLGDVASGLGIPLGDLADIYGKARVQGRLFAEDINQLTGRGIPVTAEFAKQFGVAESEVRRLVETGAIGFPHLEKAIISLTSEGGRFAGMMDKMSKSTDGLLSTLGDSINKALTNFGAPINDALKPVLEDAINDAEKLENKLANSGQEAAMLVEHFRPLIQAGPKIAGIFVFVGKMVGIIAHSLTAGVSWVAESFVRFGNGIIENVGRFNSLLTAGIQVAGNTLQNLLNSAIGDFRPALIAAAQVAGNTLHNIIDKATNWGNNPLETSFDKLLAKAKEIHGETSKLPVDFKAAFNEAQARFKDMAKPWTDALDYGADVMKNMFEESVKAVEGIASTLESVKLGLLDAMVEPSGAPAPPPAPQPQTSQAQSGGSGLSADAMSRAQALAEGGLGQHSGSAAQARQAQEWQRKADESRLRGREADALRQERFARNSLARAERQRTMGDGGAEARARDIAADNQRRNFGQHDLSRVPSDEESRSAMDKLMDPKNKRNWRTDRDQPGQQPGGWEKSTADSGKPKQGNGVEGKLQDIYGVLNKRLPEGTL